MIFLIFKIKTTIFLITIFSITDGYSGRNLDLCVTYSFWIKARFGYSFARRTDVSHFSDTVTWDLIRCVGIFLSDRIKSHICDATGVLKMNSALNTKVRRRFYNRISFVQILSVPKVGCVLPRHCRILQIQRIRLLRTHLCTVLVPQKQFAKLVF